MNHTCAAVGCFKEIPKRMLMCFPHWKLVPTSTQMKVSNSYRRIGPGGKTSKEWREASEEAIIAVKRIEISRGKI